MTRPLRDDGLPRALRRVAWCEFELVEACQRAAETAEGEERARLAQCARQAQSHLLDVDCVLRAGGDDPVHYTRCIRQAMLSTGALDTIYSRRARAYQRVLAQPGLAPDLRRRLRINAAEPERIALTSLSFATR